MNPFTKVNVLQDFGNNSCEITWEIDKEDYEGSEFFIRKSPDGERNIEIIQTNSLVRPLALACRRPLIGTVVSWACSSPSARCLCLVFRDVNPTGSLCPGDERSQSASVHKQNWGAGQRTAR